MSIELKTLREPIGPRLDPWQALVERLKANGARLDSNDIVKAQICKCLEICLDKQAPEVEKIEAARRALRILKAALCVHAASKAIEQPGDASEKFFDLVGLFNDLLSTLEKEGQYEDPFDLAPRRVRDGEEEILLKLALALSRDTAKLETDKYVI